MRTVSFSEERVREIIADQFVATFTNTKGDPSAGGSLAHSPGEPPGPCGRGAGRQNVQIIFMTPSENIFHVATGFLSADDLVDEMQFALRAFDSLELKNLKQARGELVSTQAERLNRMGFSRRDMHSNSPMQNMMTGFSPTDLGIKMPANSLFGDVARQRTLRDAKYVIAHPLISRSEFEKNPGDLVGHHKSFFASTAAMNGLNRSFGQ